GGVGDGQRVQGAVVDGAAVAGGGVAAEGGAGDGQRALVDDAGAGVGGVAAEGAVGDDQRAAVDDGAADDGGVAAEGAVGEGHRAGEVGDAAAAPTGEPAVGDGQSRDVHAGRIEIIEHAGGVIAADRDHVGTRPGDGQVLGDQQFAAGQGNGPAQARLEVHG